STVNPINLKTSNSDENGICLNLSASDLEKPGLEFIFTSDGYAYYKSAGCHQLDEEYGDIKLSIVDRETTIMIRLQNVILESATTLLDAVNVCAQLDW
uniref:Uncharacterized protein n=1 Tax=Romanomermis culicivorax TaxID=13658 RepID=A0A915KEF1_ROMCU